MNGRLKRSLTILLLLLAVCSTAAGGIYAAWVYAEGAADSREGTASIAVGEFKYGLSGADLADAVNVAVCEMIKTIGKGQNQFALMTGMLQKEGKPLAYSNDASGPYSGWPGDPTASALIDDAIVEYEQDAEGNYTKVLDGNGKTVPLMKRTEPWCVIYLEKKHSYGADGAGMMWVFTSSEPLAANAVVYKTAIKMTQFSYGGEITPSIEEGPAEGMISTSTFGEIPTNWTAS